MTRLKAALMGCIGGAIPTGAVEAESRRGMGVSVKQLVHEVGGAGLPARLAAPAAKYPADGQAGGGGQLAQYVRRRDGVSLTLLGRVYQAGDEVYQQGVKNPGLIFIDPVLRPEKFLAGS